jgi:hypothetical protein
MILYTNKPMTDLSPQSQQILDDFKQGGLYNALRVLVDSVVPHEDEAPMAVFDCEPRPSYNFKTGKCDGPLRHDHSDYLRRQFDQEKLDIRWEQRQQTRAMMLALIIEL